MDDQDRPPLGAYAFEEIAKALHEVNKSYWSELSKMRVVSPFGFGQRAEPGPAPPKLPEHLRVTLCAYARQLFQTECTEYPVSPEIERWLTKLAGRVTERVMCTVESLDASFLDAILGTKTDGLTYHGLTLTEMRQAVESALEEVKNLTLVRYQSVVEQASGAVETEAPAAISEPSHDSEPDEDEAVEAGSIEQIVEHRRKLLDDYKTATGIRADQKIYEAQNSGIYKPQFYQWKDGRLSSISKITKRFEQFLRAKRLPIPRNSTS